MRQRSRGRLGWWSTTIAASLLVAIALLAVCGAVAHGGQPGTLAACAAAVCVAALGLPDLARRAASVPRVAANGSRLASLVTRIAHRAAPVVAWPSADPLHGVLLV